MFPVFYPYPFQMPVPVPVYYQYAVPVSVWCELQADQETMMKKVKKVKKWNPKADPIHEVPWREQVIHEEEEFQPEQWMVDFKEPDMTAFD
jgi:hypothetical protein